ncbi:MAG: glycine zipper 2TM domain-containing protein [Pseudomonadota bacterium]
MNTKGLLASITASSLLFAGAVMADDHHRSSKAQYDYAQVLSADPIVRYVAVKTPRRECWQDTEIVTEHRGRQRDAGGALVGAIIGGVVGNQFGSGRGNDAATVAGALIGAAAGGNANGKGHREVVRYERPVERCETTITETQEERIDGYRVVYRYNGQRYSTRMPFDPGERLRVRVDVRPAR